jgi:6-phosphogluconate dehydrogenase
MIGLGRMGGGMARRLLCRGHTVVGFDEEPQRRIELQAAGGRWAHSPADLVASLTTPRTAWLMLPPGPITQHMLSSLAGLLAPGDTMIDGGNSHHRDSQDCARSLRERGLHFLDVGTNSGVSGVEVGYCLTVGGECAVVERHRPLFDDLAPGPELGWGHMGPAGAGHFAKMVHNAVLYGLMQAYAEGFALLRSADELQLSAEEAAQIWRHGSLVESRLLDLIAGVLQRGEDLGGIAGWVEDTGAGRWAVTEAIERNVSTPAMVAALERRIRSRESEPYADRLLAALRAEFGGHPVRAAAQLGTDKGLA